MNLTSRVVKVGDEATGIGRLINRSGWWLDPLSEGPPHPHYGGNPEPLSALSLRVTRVPASVGESHWYQCTGTWLGNALALNDVVRVADRHVLRRGPNKFDGHLCVDDALDIVEHLPDELDVTVKAVGSSNGRKNRGIVIEVDVITPAWVEHGFLLNSDTVAVLPTLEPLYAPVQISINDLSWEQ